MLCGGGEGRVSWPGPEGETRDGRLSRARWLSYPSSPASAVFYRGWSGISPRTAKSVAALSGAAQAVAGGWEAASTAGREAGATPCGWVSGRFACWRLILLTLSARLKPCPCYKAHWLSFSAGCKAHIKSAAHLPGINPRPTARMSFPRGGELLAPSGIGGMVGAKRKKGRPWGLPSGWVRVLRGGAAICRIWRGRRLGRASRPGARSESRRSAGRGR